MECPILNSQNPFDQFYGAGAGAQFNEYGGDDFYNFFNNMNGGGGARHQTKQTEPRMHI